MKLTKRNITKGFTLVELLVVISIIAALAAMATPVIMKQAKKAAATTAVSNAKQIFYLLVEFDNDFNQFPGKDITDVDLVARAGGSTSNELFSMFFDGGYTTSEEIFFAKGGADKKGSPDNVITAAKLLEAGECGFAYISNMSTSDNSGRPIVMAPMPETAEKFDKDPYDGKAIVLRIDGAVKQLLISKTFEAKDGEGTLFDTTHKGVDGVWAGDFTPADLLLPES